MVRISPASSSSQLAPFPDMPSLVPRPYSHADARDKHGHPHPSGGLLLQISIEETRDVGEGFLRLRRIGVELVLRVRLAFIDVEVGDHAGAPQFAMGPDCVAQEQIARARG